MADYNAVMAQLDAQAQQAAQQRMAEMIKAGQVINMGVGEDGKPSYYYAGGDQARVEPHNLLADALVYGMMDYIKANPNDPVAQQMQADLWENQKNAHKGDFGSFLHGAAVFGALGGALGGFGAPGMGLGESLAAQGGLIPADVMGPPAGLAPDVFVGPPQTPGSLPPDFMGPPGGLAPAEFMGPAQPAQNLPSLESLSAEGGLTAGDLGLTPAQATPGATGGVLSPQNYPMPAPTAPPAATPVPAPAGAGAAGATGTIASKLNELFGLNLTDSDLSLLGKLGGAGLGLLGANAQTDALKGILDQQRAERAPALNAFNNMLSNPNDWYNSAPAMGATEGVLRKLSVNGNPAGNPSDLAKAAAYNLGGYNQMLGTLGSLGLSGQATTAQLGTQLAQAGQTPYNIGANLLGQLTTPQQNPFEQWMAAATKYGKPSEGVLP